LVDNIALARRVPSPSGGLVPAEAAADAMNVAAYQSETQLFVMFEPMCCPPPINEITLNVECSLVPGAGANVDDFFYGVISLWDFTQPEGFNWIELNVDDGIGVGRYAFTAPADPADGERSTRRTFTVRDAQRFFGDSGEVYALFRHVGVSSGASAEEIYGPPFTSRYDLVQLLTCSDCVPEEECPYCVNLAAGPTGADRNYDGVVDADDLSDFASSFADGQSRADADGDLSVTVDDAVLFLQTYSNAN
jgi:hypothetical protein